jgi:hypothetical protein
MIDVIFAMFIGFILCRIWIIERNLVFLGDMSKGMFACLEDIKKIIEDICKNKETK